MQVQFSHLINGQVRLNSVWVALILALSLGSCTATKTTVEKASRQKYYGGAAGSGGGNIYRVYLAKSPKSELSIDRVWVGDRETGYLPRFAVYRDSTSEVLRDAILPNGVSMARLEFTEPLPAAPNPRQGDENGPEPPKQDDPPYDLPVDFVKGVVIWYTPSNGKSAYWIVDDFVQLSPLYHP